MFSLNDVWRNSETHINRLNIVCAGETGMSKRGRPRKELELNMQAIREMRKREDKLRAIFGAEKKPISWDKRRLMVSLHGSVLDDIAQIRYLSEVDTWKYIPEEVAELVFERIVSTRQYIDDDDVAVEELSDSAIVHMAVRLLRLYLQGANPWNRKLIPKVLQVNRDDVTRTQFMKKFKHGADLEPMFADDTESEGDGFYTDDVPDWDSL